MMNNKKLEIDPEAFQKDLESISNCHGIPFGRLEEYWQAETDHVYSMRSSNAGTLLLIRAFQSMFLEAVELTNVNSIQSTASPSLPFFTRFLPKFVHVFHQLCASELAATHGYPLPAYTILRNVFDQLVLLAASMLRLTDLNKADGYDPNIEYSPNSAKTLGIKNERAVRRKMLGKESGLSNETVNHLKIWDALFDFEVHGARLSLTTAIDWINGNGALQVYPHYNSSSVTTYSNRVCEICWMAHRLLPLIQHSALHFPAEWKAKWRLLDSRFEDQVRHFANEQVDKVGLGIIELVMMKFPFNESTLYPLEGLSVCECSASQQ